VFGGPRDYTDRLGGYERMLAHHRGLSITAAQRLRFATTMSQAADDARLPADPEFRAAPVGYLEWGTRLAMGNPQPRATPRNTPRSPGGAGVSPRPTRPRTPPQVRGQVADGVPVARSARGSPQTG
jgi:hemoglobin